MPQGPAARLTDAVMHPTPPVLTGGPPATTVLIGMMPAWKGVPLAASPGLMAASTATEATLQTFETVAKVAEAAALAAAGTPGAPVAIALATAARLAAETAKSSSAAANAASIAAAAATGASMHACAMPWPIPPHGPGVVIDGSPTVMIENCPACRLGDTIIEAIGPPNKIMMGCMTVIIGGGSAGGAGAGAPGGTGPGGLAVTTVTHWFGDDDVKVGNAIIIKGSPAFQKQVLDRLEKIGKTPSGKALLARLDKSGKTMVITEYTGDNSFAGADDTTKATPKGKGVFDGEGKPVKSMLGFGPQEIGTGEGSDVTLQFNPGLNLPNSKNGPMPNDAVLFHEMTHGAHQMEGTSDCSPDPTFDTNEEKTTISTGTPNEAQYLKESGYPYKRADHDTTWVANP